MTGAPAGAGLARVRSALLGALIACCVLAPILAQADTGGPLRVVCGAALLLLAPGVALTPRLTGRRAGLDLVIVLAVSLAVVGLGAQVLLWLGLWHPLAATWLLAVVCLAALVPQARALRRDARSAPTALAVPRLPRADRVHAAVILVALALWIVALTGAEPGRISGWGLLGTIGPTFALSLLVLAGGFVAAVGRARPSSVVLATYTGALIVVLSTTTAILYEAPRYAWVYKHFSIIDYIRVHGDTPRELSIYFNWPAFFAGNAWFSRVIGVAPIDYANWAQLFFDVCNVCVVLFVVRGATRDVRVQWIAVFLFQTGNWIGQDYLAPQAYAFVLGMLAIGLLLRCAPLRGPPRNRLDRWAERWIGALAARVVGRRRTWSAGGEPAPYDARTGLRLALVFFAATVVSHQLTPVFVLLAAGGLCVFARRPPVRIVATMAAMEAVWLFLARDELLNRVNLFDFQPSVSVRQIGASVEPLAGVALASNLSRAAIVLVGLIALAGVVLRLRRGHWDPAPLVLLAGPVIVLPLQSYGGEGPLRCYLFALPGAALFAAGLLRPRPDRPAWRRGLPLLAVTWVVGAFAMTGLYGQETTNYFTRSDTAASRWIYDNAVAESPLYYLGSYFPGPITAAFAREITVPDALSEAPFPKTATALAAEVAPKAGMGSGYAYVLFLPSSRRSLVVNGVLSAAEWERLLFSVRISPRFEIVYNRPDAAIFRIAAAA